MENLKDLTNIKILKLLMFMAALIFWGKLHNVKGYPYMEAESRNQKAEI